MIKDTRASAEETTVKTSHAAPTEGLAVLPSRDDSRTCGTLQYTGMGLVCLFVWLLMGDFTWTLMEAAPGVLPLKLKAVGASDFWIMILVTTVPSVLTFLVTPAISFRSDRYRSKRGRRIPFLLYSTPFTSAFLILLGFSEYFGWQLYAPLHAIFGSLTQSALIVGIMGVLVVLFQFANTFVQTIYWYLFNDVVPSAYLSRFFALMRIVSTLAGMLWSKYIFPTSVENFHWILLAAGIIYMIAFSLMCVMLKEGKYPPPPENIDKRPGIWSSIKTYAEECFTHKFYWYFFLYYAFWVAAGPVSVYGVFRNRDSLGMTMQEMGDMGFWCGWISLVLYYPTGWLSDRIHPLTTYLVTTFLLFGKNLVDFIWLVPGFSFDHSTMLTIMWAQSLVGLPIGAMWSAADIPMQMRMLPKERYGQFGSANAMIRSFTGIFAGIIAGIAMDYVVKDLYGGSAYGYRWMPVWSMSFTFISIIFLTLLFMEFKKRGGSKSFTPPPARKMAA